MAYSDVLLFDTHGRGVGFTLSGNLFYSLQDGPVGYVLQTDTFKLFDLLE